MPELEYGHCFTYQLALLLYRCHKGKHVLETHIVDKLYTCISVGVWRLCSARNASSSSPQAQLIESTLRRLAPFKRRDNLRSYKNRCRPGAQGERSQADQGLRLLHKLVPGMAVMQAKAPQRRPCQDPLYHVSYSTLCDTSSTFRSDSDRPAPHHGTKTPEAVHRVFSIECEK